MDTPIEMPDSLQFRKAVAAILEENRDVVLARVSKEFPDDRGLTILHYTTRNLDNGMFPFLMIEQGSIRSEWVAMPSLMRVTFTARILGYVWHDDPERLDAMCSCLEGGLRDCLNRRHLRAPLTDRLEMFFDDDQPPISSTIFGATMINSRLVKGFESTFTAKADVQVPPIYPA
jgi:hypothetical protein